MEDIQRGDVTGDGVMDAVVLTGDRPIAGMHTAATHELIIIDGKTGGQTTLSLGEGSGADGSVQLEHFTGDNVDDILVAMPATAPGEAGSFFLLSARGGTPAVLIDPHILSAGAHFRLALQDNYRLQVVNSEQGKRFTLDLREATPNTQRYHDIYAANGKLRKQVECAVDPLSTVELLRTAPPAPAALVGYQQIWVRDRNNPVATVRAVWQWTGDTLRLTDVRMLPAVTPEQYAGRLTDLASEPPANAVPRAVTYYAELFNDQPPATRDQAFLRFLDFHRTFIAHADQTFRQHSIEICRRCALAHHGDASARLAELVAAFNNLPANQQAGLAAISPGEGRCRVVPRAGFYTAQFAQHLTADYREFLALQDVEEQQPWVRDGLLLISLTSLAGRISAWEQYLVTYPNSPFAVMARDIYQAQLDAFLYGTKQSSLFNMGSGALRPGVAVVMQGYVNEHPDTASAILVTRVLAIYRAAHYQQTPALNAALAQCRAEQDPVRIPNYYPQAVGSAWSYPTGGVENAGFQAQVQYRLGCRFQLGVQSASGRAIRRYVVHDDSIALVYQDEKATVTDYRLRTRNNMVQIILRAPLVAGSTWTSNDLRFEIRQVNVPHVVLCHLYPSTIEVVCTPQAASARPWFEIHDFYAPGIGLVESRQETAGAATDALLGAYTRGKD